MFISVSLAMDACTIAILYGLTYDQLKNYQLLAIASYFGLFQSIMPLLGYLLGLGLASVIGKVDHYIAFGLLSIMGINMIKDSFSNDSLSSKFSFLDLTLLAIATSVDAFAIGITFAFFNVNIVLAITIIGLITMILCYTSIRLGKLLSQRFKTKAMFLGGLILLFLGIKILFQHLIK